MSQIFKQRIPNNILFDLLEKISIKADKYYLINYNSFKKGLYNESISTFIETCKMYYHLSKHKYLNKATTYNSFITVVRQICNNNNIKYTSNIKYDKSSYDIVYYIYLC
jgi:hypothetical protein